MWEENAVAMKPAWLPRKRENTRAQHWLRHCWRVNSELKIAVEFSQNAGQQDKEMKAVQEQLRVLEDMSITQ